ncbi:HPt domain-containing protein [Thiovulum sp. ES]|nr:HPt domain-containing protein [Thiovulum sp. ES]
MIIVPTNKHIRFSKDAVAKELGVPPMFVDKLVGKLLKDIDHDIRELEHAIDSKDAEKIASLAHRIKGASANLRLKYLADLFLEIELPAKSGVFEGFDNLIDACKKEVEHIRGVMG